MTKADEKLDVLAFSAHPDDIELAAAGTLAKLIKQGYKVGIIDMTRQEGILDCVVSLFWIGGDGFTGTFIEGWKISA